MNKKKKNRKIIKAKKPVAQLVILRTERTPPPEKGKIITFIGTGLDDDMYP